MNSNHYSEFLRQTISNVSRRGFLKGVGAGAFVLAISPAIGKGADAPKYAGAGMANGIRDDAKIFIAIGEDGTVTITNIRAEMGQGIRTGIALAIADELEADMAKVKVVQAEANEAKYGNQDTDGSRSTRHHFAIWRHMGATARTMLHEAAAAQWKVPVAQVTSYNHEVMHKASGRKLGYGALATAAAAMTVPANGAVKLKHPSEFRYIGTGKVKLVDLWDITTGHTTYGQDVRLPGMLYASIARAPVHFGTLDSYDDSETMKVPGVVKVVKIDPVPGPALFLPKAGVAVIAKNTWAAMQGRDALKIKWVDGDNKTYSSDTYRASLEESVRKPALVLRNDGDAMADLASAPKKVTAEYYIPHLAHVPMEPPAATAVVADGKAEIWACVQGPQAAVGFTAQRLGLKPENVTVHQTLLGGGFGRKSKVDFAVEAALLSQAMGGTPVKNVFSREDDIHNDYLHTVSAERIEAGMDASGKVTSWLHRSAAPSMIAIFDPTLKHEHPIEIGMGLLDMPFAIPNVRIENPEAVAHTRIGWFRSVSNVPHAFASQSFVAEMAVAAGKDQKDFLLALLGPDRKMNNKTDFKDGWNYGEDPEKYMYETARLRKVIETVAKAANWGKSMPKGTGMGIAAHRSFASYTAAVIQVDMRDGNLVIPRVDIAVDAGPTPNPDRVRAMMEGSVIMGVGLATQGEISFKDGRVEQSNFDTFKVTRIDGSPREIVVHIIPEADWSKPLGGVGEPGLPPIAPALCNAIFNATGKRIRTLPIRDQLGVA
jgi:isoquinoline 1-oxidoreductase subunit beta